MAMALSSIHEDDKYIDIEAISDKFDECIAVKYPKPTIEDVVKYKPMIDKLLQGIPFYKLKREFSYSYKNSYIYNVFLIIIHGGGVGAGFAANTYSTADHEKLKSLLKIKGGRSHSGIISITIFTGPHPEYTNAAGEKVRQNFSCEYNCSYCPNEPGQPRSYLKGEPGVLRANREEFDCVRQMYIRMEALYLTGHDIDKLEVLVLGGTWTSYPVEYRNEFIRDMYYAANTFTDYIKVIIMQNIATNFDIEQARHLRQRLSLTEEKAMNKYAGCRIIGLTLETRPDTITRKELIRFRSYGCTRIQLGIQHIDDSVLNKINRRCPTMVTISAIKMLKNCGYKIDAHFMPNLPGSNVSMDEEMFDKLLGVWQKRYGTTYMKLASDATAIHHEQWVLKHPELQVDQWKIYPTTITPFTEIKKWYDEGTYVPYPNTDLYNLIYKVKTLIYPWIRLNRCIRDICADYVPQKDYESNMRQHIQEEFAKSGVYCQCIRCREVKKGDFSWDEAIMVSREYNASGGVEYFISCESPNKRTIYGFLRLRLCNGEEGAAIFPELADAALIRELHVYSEMKPHNDARKEMNTAQHRGIGKKLMATAEKTAHDKGFYKISVIAGQGVKGYYEKLGYANDLGEGDFMIKYL